MRKIAANKTVRIISGILSASVSFLFFAAFFCVISLGSLGVYTNSYEVSRLSYIDSVAPSDSSTLNFYNIINEYRNGTLDEYSANTNNLYTISIADRIIASNYDNNTVTNAGDSYIANSDNVVLYNNSGDKLVEYNVTIYTPTANTNQLEVFNRLYSLRYTLIEVCVISLIILTVTAFLLIHGAGYTQTLDSVKLRKIDQIPFTRLSTYLLAYTLLQIVVLIFLGFIFDQYSRTKLLTYGALMAVEYLLLLNWYITLTVLARFNKTTRRSIFNKDMSDMLSSIASGLKHLPLIWKTIIFIILWCALEIWIIISFHDSLITLTALFILTRIVIIPFIISISLILQKFKSAANRIASGEFGYRLHTNNMWGEFAEFGDTLNSISYGMNKAIDDRMQSELKSEHFKTELITNVSHDIKTPLTSIINYVNLIKKEEHENETIDQYVDVLDRQSTRLKKLLEDLIEASKAMTGNLKVCLVPCELNVLLAQISGEYEDLLARKNLELVIAPPEKTINVMADGRHLWRVIDNLMTNIYKYSQESTRVYISLHSPVYDTNHAFLTFKNVSKAPLNISSEELMERFTRGDSSRNTEGSGLGLSIVKSLTELQNAVFTIDIDGDLFKSVIRFDVLDIPDQEDDDILSDINEL